MKTIYDPTPVGYRWARIPDIDDESTRRTTSLPGGCDCRRNYRAPHYRPCVHVRLLRTGVPLGDLRTGMLADGTPVYRIRTRDAYYCHRTRGFSPGLWEHTLCFDGETFYVESTKVDTKFTTTHVIDDWRIF